MTAPQKRSQNIWVASPLLPPSPPLMVVDGMQTQLITKSTPKINLYPEMVYGLLANVQVFF